MTKIYLIAGEVSGDFIGSQLIKSLKDIYGPDEKLELFGIGGEKMEQAGIGRSLFPIEQINLMGFVEIIPHIFAITKLINQTIDDIIHNSPDLLITIDSPGFTYRVARKVRKHLPNLKMLHIVAPSVWAYKEGRAAKYAKLYNYLFALLPFEPPYFQKLGLDCRYIGHPIVEQKYYNADDKKALRKSFGIASTTKVLCVTPGSRKGEIIRHMPIFSKALDIAAKQLGNLEVIFVIANLKHQTLIESYLPDAVFKYRFSQDKLKIFSASDAALAKSGTNTLEIAASGTPMIVAYKLNVISYYLIRWLIKIPYISIINIIASRDASLPRLKMILGIVNSGAFGARNDGAKPISNRRATSDDATKCSSIDYIIPELIQFDCTKENIASHLIELLTDKDKAALQIQNNHSILKKLGFQSPDSPSNIAANIIKSEILKTQ